MVGNITKHKQAENYFITTGQMPDKHSRKERWVLHHIDPELKRTDFERYCEWRVEDLIPMTHREHRKLHSVLEREWVKHDNKGEKNPMYGKHHSNESRALMSQKAKLRPVTKGNTGMHWYTNGVINKQAYECPVGFHLGRTTVHVNTEVTEQTA